MERFLKYVSIWTTSDDTTGRTPSTERQLDLARYLRDELMHLGLEDVSLDENGYVMYPNVNIITEMTNLIDASRSYEANATAFNASKNLATRGLEIGNG